MTNQCCLSFVKVAANSRKIVEFGIAKKFGFVVFVGISSPLLTVSDIYSDYLPQILTTMCQILGACLAHFLDWNFITAIYKGFLERFDDH